jgi:hypothetical protein
MYEFNGWFVLKESAEPKPGIGAERARIDALTDRLSHYRWSASRIDIVELDRQYCLRLTGMMHRNRGQSRELHELIDVIAHDLPGSYGLLYEWSDEPDLNEPASAASAQAGSPNEGAFHVHVLEHGVVSERADPFLSVPQPALGG